MNPEEIVKNEDKPNVAVLFKQTREQNEWTQVDMATFLGITQGALSKIESGQMNPNYSTYIRFSRNFQVEILQ